jgi:hypothetical protein
MKALALPSIRGAALLAAALALGVATAAAAAVTFLVIVGDFHFGLRFLLLFVGNRLSPVRNDRRDRRLVRRRHRPELHVVLDMDGDWSRGRGLGRRGLVDRAVSRVAAPAAAATVMVGA